MQYKSTPELREERIRNNLSLVRDKIHIAAKKSGRAAEEITLIGVSKFFPPEYIQYAFSCGIFAFGENRVQELVEKKEMMEKDGVFPEWHMIGTLQTNKVRHLVSQNILIHSISSYSLLDEVQKRSAAGQSDTKVLLQVNIGKEESKHGFFEEEMERVLDYAQRCDAITLCGLMAMAPLSQNIHDAIPYFEKMRKMFDCLSGEISQKDTWKILSMGMSGDYEDAVVCGATHVRIGTAIFGRRDDKTKISSSFS